MLPQIIQMLGSCKVSVYGRDNMMELLIKFVTRKDGIGWSKKFIAAQGFSSIYILLVVTLIYLPQITECCQIISAIRLLFLEHIVICVR